MRQGATMRARAIAATVLLSLTGIAGAFASAPTSARPFARYLGDLPPGTEPPPVAANPYENNLSAPKLYDGQGRYGGNLSRSPYDPNASGNPYSRLGNPYSPYRQDSPNNPYGQGIGVYRYPP
jgi:hypothetical protein